MYKLIFIFSLLIPALAQTQDFNTQDINNSAKFARAQTELSFGEDAKAASILREILSSDSTYRDAYILLADIYNSHEKYDGLCKLYEKASRILGDEVPEFIVLYGNTLYTLGRMDEARVQYEKVINRSKQYEDVIGNEKQSEASIKIAMRMLEKCINSAEFKKKPVPFNPVNIGEMINSNYDEYLPSFSIDQSVMFITRKIPGGSDPVTGNDVNDEDFYYSIRNGSGWAKAKSAPGLNTRGNEGAHCLSADGNTLIFTACNRYDSYGACDLYISRKRGDEWTTPVNMGADVNSGSWDSQPSISSDGKTLYFSSNRKGGSGGSDIWMSKLNVVGRWEAPVNLGDTINSPENEISPFIHPDGVTMYFASKGHPGVGNFDIFMSKKNENGKWSLPVNLGYPINTELDDMSMIVDASGKTAYFASFRSEGFGGQDIYYFELYPEVRAGNVTWIKGHVTDAVTGSFLKGKVELYHIQSGSLVYSGTADADGNFLACFHQNGDFAVNVTYKGYLMYSGNFNVSGDHAKTPFVKEIPMQPIVKGASMNLHNIFFDTDLYVLKPESCFELDKLYAFLAANSGVAIKIAGHTDNQGSDEHNITLSKNRAEVVMKYLLDKGIAQTRMITEGFGLSRPVADNNTPEGRALNRRTEIIITGLK